MTNTEEILEGNAAHDKDVLYDLSREFSNPAIGKKFFSSLTEFMAKALKVDYITIGVLSNDKNFVRTVAYYVRGEIQKNIEYPLAGTPCETIIEQKFCACPEKLQEKFPKDDFLAEQGIESYIGYPLCNSEGEAFGLISMMHSEPYHNTEFAEALLKIVAPRVELELERNEHEEGLQKKNFELAQYLEAAQQRYKFIIEAANQGVWEYNIESGEAFYNDRVYEQLGLPVGYEFTMENYFGLVHPDDRDGLRAAMDEGIANHQPWEYEYRIRHSSGDYRYLIARGAAIYNSEGKAIRTAGMVMDITERKNSEEMLEFLSRASEELSFSLRLELTLKNISHLIVPRLADWFAIDVLKNDGTLRRLLTAHKDPEKVQWAEELAKEYPTEMNSPTGIPNILRTGKSELYTDIPREILVKAARDERHMQIIDEIGFRSVMIVPLTAKGKTFGGISFVTTDESGRHYSELDLRLAEDFARRVALAIENNRLYEEAEAEKEKFRQLLEALPQMAWTSRPDGYVDYLNKAWYEFTGANEGELKAWNWEKYIHPDDYNRTYDAWMHCLQTGELYEIEYRWRRRDGEYRWHIGRANSLRNSSGEIILWIGTATDIHDQKSTEENLAEQTRALELINKVGKTISAELNLDKIVQEVTNITTELIKAEYGAFFYNVISKNGESYTLYTLSGAPREAFAHMPMPRNTAIFGPTFKGEGIVRSDDISKDPRYGKNPPYHGMPKGHLPVVSYLAVPVISNSGEVVGGLFYAHSRPGVFTEESEHLVEGIAAQAAIAIDNARLFNSAKENEENFRILTDVMPQMVWATRPDGYHEYYNQHWYDFTGLTFEQSKEEGWSKVLHPDDYARTLAVWSKSLSTGEPYRIEYRMKRYDGEYRWFLARALPQMSAEGKIVKWFGTCTDIHDQKIFAEELERRVEERTAELVESNTELGRSNLDLEQFAYVASHDLKEPLRMISSYTQLLAKRYQGKLDEDADEFIHFIIEGAKRMHDLIADLLNYSRVGRLNITMVEVNAEDSLAIAEKNLLQSIQETKTTITHDTLPSVKVVPAYLVQLFQNLVANAIKFAGEKNPVIHIGVDELDSEWQFCIKDNGIGIEKEYLDRIFVIFQRLHTREEYPGTGIGLAICKKIVEYHGGNIWVESEPGAGSTFYFTLPK